MTDTNCFNNLQVTPNSVALLLTFYNTSVNMRCVLLIFSVPHYFVHSNSNCVFINDLWIKIFFYILLSLSLQDNQIWFIKLIIIHILSYFPNLCGYLIFLLKGLLQISPMSVSVKILLIYLVTFLRNVN